MLSQWFSSFTADDYTMCPALAIVRLAHVQLWLVAYDVRVLDLPIRAVDEPLRRVTVVVQSDGSNDEDEEECQDHSCYRPRFVSAPRVVLLRLGPPAVLVWLIMGSWVVPKLINRPWVVTLRLIHGA